MNTRLIISYVFAQITKGGYGRESQGHSFHLFSRSYSYRSAFTWVRYRPRPDADGVTFSFQIGKNKWYQKNKDHTKWSGLTSHHEVWILQNEKTYYFVPISVLAELCLWPGSYRHPEYDPDHRLIHINTQTHRCFYAGKQEDFSLYYRATLEERRWSPKVNALLKKLGDQDFVPPFQNH